MITPQDLVGAFARNVMLVRSQAEGLSHEESMLQLPFRGNCLNWVIGHITISRDDVLELLGQPPLAEPAMLERYRRGSEPIDGAGAPGALPLAELLAKLDQTQEHLAAALAPLGDADMQRPVTIGERTSTLGQRVFFLYFHESYHVGQTELLRQLAGKNDKVI